MCKRRACLDNVNVDVWQNSAMLFDGSVVFAILETMFLMFFWFEYLLRLYVSFSRRKFCRREYMSLIFVSVLFIEYLVVILRNQVSGFGFVYDPWGIPPLENVAAPFRVDSHSLRLLRLLVPMRFVWITSDFKGIENLKTTMHRTASRLIPFVFMFTICCIQLTFFMFYAEIISCKPALVKNGRFFIFLFGHHEGAKVVVFCFNVCC